MENAYEREGFEELFSLAILLEETSCGIIEQNERRSKSKRENLSNWS